MRYAPYTIIEVATGKVGFSSDQEMADHVSMYPDDYVLWQRVTLRSVTTVTRTGLDRVEWSQ